MQRDPWEQQESEPSEAFAAFADYRDQPPHRRRRLKGLKNKDGEEYNYYSLRNWNNIYHWKERAAAWDREMDRQAREFLILQRQTSALRHFDLTNEMLGILEAKIATMQTPEAIAALTPRDVKDWLAIAVQTQRLSLDMSTQISENREGEVQDATEAMRQLLQNPAAAQKVAELGDMLLNEHPRSEPHDGRTAPTHLRIVESAEPGGEAE